MSQPVDIVDDVCGTLLIGLDRKPKTVPTRKRVVAERRFDHVERQLQPVGFLGIDGEIQIVSLGLTRERDQSRHQFGHHPFVADGLEARMQRGELYGDARPVGQGTLVHRVADRFDRALIGVEIAFRISGGASAFAEHVEGIARGGRGMRPGERGFNGLAKHEMASHQPHGLPRRGADGGCAEPFCQPSDCTLRRLARLNHPRRDAERPGRRVDQEGARLGLVADEIALAELVLDKLVGGAGIGDA